MNFDNYFSKLAKNLIQSLPDVFQKKSENNLSKFLRLFSGEAKEIQENIKLIKKNNDIDSAENIFLDHLGQNIGQNRGGLSNDAYRIAIKSKIGQNFSPGDINSLLEYISVILNRGRSEIKLYEGFGDEFKSLWGYNEPAALILMLDYFDGIAELPFETINKLFPAAVLVNWLVIYSNKKVGVSFKKFDDQSLYYHAGQLYSKPKRTPSNKAKLYTIDLDAAVKNLAGQYLFPKTGEVHSGSKPQNRKSKLFRTKLGPITSKIISVCDYSQSGHLYSGAKDIATNKAEVYNNILSTETTKSRGYSRHMLSGHSYSGQRVDGGLFQVKMDFKVVNLAGCREYPITGKYHCGEIA